eukprot:5152798-Prymnesium_polylepis.2
MLDTKLQPQTTKPVSKTTTSMSHTTFHPVTSTVPTSPMAAPVEQRRRVVGADPPEPPPHRRKHQLSGLRLSSWLQKDQHAAALALQRAWRRHAAKQVRLLLAFERAAGRENKEQEFTTKTHTSTNKQRANSINPRAKCRYHPCRKPWCHFAHEPGQQQLAAPCVTNATTNADLADKDTTPNRTESTNECPVCFIGLALDNIGVLACGHAACFACVQACVARDARCPICRAEATSVLKMRV